MKKKTLNPSYFPTLYLIHFLFIFNDLKSYGAPCKALWKLFEVQKKMEKWPKSLSFKSQFVLMCLNPQIKNGKKYLKPTFLPI